MRWQQFKLGTNRKAFTRVGEIDTAQIIAHEGIARTGGGPVYHGGTYGTESAIDLL
jgi:hypothetical protein